MRSSHHGMDKQITDAIARRLTTDSVVTVDGEPVVHIPFGLYDRPEQAVVTNGMMIDIASRSWQIETIRGYDPETGDFTYGKSGETHVVSVRTLPRAA